MAADWALVFFGPAGDTHASIFLLALWLSVLLGALKMDDNITGTYNTRLVSFRNLHYTCEVDSACPLYITMYLILHCLRLTNTCIGCFRTVSWWTVMAPLVSSASLSLYLYFIVSVRLRMDPRILARRMVKHTILPVMVRMPITHATFYSQICGRGLTI